ncbi:MAG TPA: hypothetical protein VLV83_10705 [Acidobacteriota bacterium]|nr:hypothetical protein [Acidobacteriota bacterium]
MLSHEEKEIYLSGYLDGELPQQQRQEVEAMLEADPDMRQLYEKMREIKGEVRHAAAMTIEMPTGEDWADVQNNLLGRASRRMGGLILAVWLLMVTLYGLYWYAFQTQDSLIEKVVVFGLISGLGLLFFSVLSERIKESRTDRYKGVHR